ncbi:MAG: type II secretion system protein GspJ [Planctomycetota bacterium]
MISRTTGFTLVEVLVASTIGTFVALVAVGTLRAITASSEMVEYNISAAAEVRFASNMISRDLVNLYRDENRRNTKLIGMVEESEQGSTSYLVFYTTSRAKARIGQPEGDVYEVDYYLLKDEEQSVLMRRLWPNPNEEDEPGGILTAIAEDIDVFEVRFFDGEEWSSEWPEEMEILPQLIEVNIVAKVPSRGEPAMESFIVNFIRSAVGTAGTVESDDQEGSGEESSGQSSAGTNTGTTGRQ